MKSEPKRALFDLQLNRKPTAYTTASPLETRGARTLACRVGTHADACLPRILFAFANGEKFIGSNIGFSLLVSSGPSDFEHINFGR